MICLVPVKNSVSEILLMIQTHSFLVKIMQSELESDVNHGMYWESSSYKLTQFCFPNVYRVETKAFTDLRFTQYNFLTQVRNYRFKRLSEKNDCT